jgi:hypothetical protein
MLGTPSSVNSLARVRVDRVRQPTVGGRIGGDHAGRELQQVHRIAAGQRQVLNAAIVDHLADVGVGRFENGRFGGDRDRIGDAAELELDRDIEHVGDADLQGAAAKRLEPCVLHLDSIRAGRQVGRFVNAFGVGDRGRGDVRFDVDDAHRGAGHYSARCIGNCTGDPTIGILGRQRGQSQETKYDGGQ